MYSTVRRSSSYFSMIGHSFFNVHAISGNKFVSIFDCDQLLAKRQNATNNLQPQTEVTLQCKYSAEMGSCTRQNRNNTNLKHETPRLILS